MQYAHNLSFKKTKTFFFIIFIIIRAMILKIVGEGTVTQHTSIIADLIQGLTHSESWDK